MGALAAGRPLPAAGAPAVKLESIRVEEHLFSPRSYDAIAREALGPPGAARPASAEDARKDARLQSALLDPQADVLVTEDLELSRRLAAEPGDPGLHERAALLLSTFALTDCAGVSTDIRPALVRTTAHLALARSLRSGGEPGSAGRFAEAALVTLVGRERDAVARLDALAAAATGPAEKAWLRALRLRNTGDFRIAEAEKRLTLLETLEEFRTRAMGQGDDAAVAWLETRDPAAIPDWARIVFHGTSTSMETSNRYAHSGLMLDLKQAADVITRYRGALQDESTLLEALEARPAISGRLDAQGRPGLEVLGQELWADRLQRNLVFALVNADNNYRKAGLPGERMAFAEQARARFGRLSLYPIVLRAHTTDGDGYRRAMAAVRELAVHSPERVTGGHWALVLEKVNFGSPPNDLPNPSAWFSPALPEGTLLEVEWRILALAELQALSGQRLSSLRELAPHNLALAFHAVSLLQGDQRTVAGLAAAYGPVAEFRLPTMADLANAAWYDPAEFRKRQGALCEIDAKYCLMLGYRLAELGFADEAAVAYQRGFDKNRDRVEAANESRWLVDYYFDHGQLRKAEAVAREAAGIYSSAGLFTMARLMERMGRLDEAEEYYRRILERYRNATQLAGFYYRQARGEKKGAYEARLRETLALALPAGLEPLDRASLAPKPEDGVVIKQQNDNTSRYGIQRGHVLVGIDGFRIRDVEAYHVVRALSQSPRMRLVVWRGKGYDDVEVELWDRQFRVEIETLGAGRAP